MVEKEQVILRLKALFDLLTPLSNLYTLSLFVVTCHFLGMYLISIVCLQHSPTNSHVSHHNIICTVFTFLLTTQMIPLCLGHHHRYFIITNSLLKGTADPFRIIRRGYKCNSVILNLLHNPTINLRTKCSQ